MTRPRPRTALALACTAALLGGLAGCGDDDPVAAGPSSSPAASTASRCTPPAPTATPTSGGSAAPTTTAPAGTTAAPAPGADPAATDLTVFAAKSLTESLTELAEGFEKAHPGSDVTLSFAGSQELVAQVQQGAPADVLATADQQTMDKVATDLAAPGRVFAANQLSIVTAKGNPLGITGLADLAKPSTKVVLAGLSVPVGKAACKALEAAGVQVAPVSEEPDVKAVLAKVRLDEADAGIVYVTDVQAAAADVTGIELPGVSNTYPIAVLDDAAHRPAAEAFEAYVLSPPAQAVLAGHGFKPAP